MLRYWNAGPRDYGNALQTLAGRSSWEFQAVVAGRCAPVERLGTEPALTERTLWVFPPGHLHGWASPPGRSCRIVVAQFDRVPPAVQAAGCLTKPLTLSEARKVERLILDLRADYETPTQFSVLRIERALLDLSLMALSATAERRVDPTTNKVTQALAWFAENMSDRPSVGAVARAVHVSESHLRRLFAEGLGDAPRTEMRRLQIDRARKLITTTDRSLGDIASACGFGSLSDFSRVFHRVTGHPPRVLRGGPATRDEERG